MEKIEQAYIQLRRHLDRQPVGFPATRSGSELRILKHIFTPEEAEIATCLTYKPEPIEVVFARAAHLAASPDALAEKLGAMDKKGGVGVVIKADRKHYCNLPLVVGMFEFQLDRLTPEFIKDFDAYTSDKRFGIDFISAKLPQMRTIPIAKSIRPQHRVSSFDEVAALVRQAQAPFVILECICRKKKGMEGKPCGVTDRKETCMAVGRVAEGAVRNRIGREIARDEAMAILEQNQKQGLVLQPSNTEQAEFICSCCGCCCGMLRMHRQLPRPLDYWVSNYHAVVDMAACNGCGTCEKRCQAGAIAVSAERQKAMLDLNRCIGCGACVPTCPQEAICLTKKSVEARPPQTWEELYDIIGSHKKGTWGKTKVTGKFILDAVRTGQTHLLK
jgi:ferredoxin